MEMNESARAAAVASLAGEPSPTIETQPQVEDQVQESENVVQDSVVEVDSAAEVVEQQVEPTAFELDYDSFNKRFGTEVSAESFDEFVNHAKGYSDLEAKIEEYDNKIASQEDLLKKQFDPMEYFSSEDDFLNQQIKKKFPDKDPSILSNISPSKIDEMDGLDALKTQLLLDNPNLEGGEVGAEELIKYKYGIDEETPYDEWTSVQKNQILIDSKSAKESLKSMYNDIKIPEKPDFTQFREKLKESWSEPLQATVDGINELKLTDDFTFKLDSNMKQGLHEELMDLAVNSNTSLSEEALRNFAGEMRSKVLQENIDKILSSYANQKVEEAKAKFRAEVHNDTSLHNESRPEGSLSPSEAAMAYLLG